LPNVFRREACCGRGLGQFIVQINSADPGIVGVDRDGESCLEKTAERIAGIAGHRAGLDVAGEAALKPDAVLKQKIQQGRILDGAQAMADAFVPRQVNRHQFAAAGCRSIRSSLKT